MYGSVSKTCKTSLELEKHIIRFLVIISNNKIASYKLSKIRVFYRDN